MIKKRNIWICLVLLNYRLKITFASKKLIIHELRLDFEIYQRINSNFEMKKISSFGFEKISWTSFEKKVQKLSNDEIYFSIFL